MLKKIDNLLNSITMYRLVLYVLLILASQALLLSFVGLLPFKALDLFYSLVLYIAAGYAINLVLARLFNVPNNVESAFITSLILYLIMPPVSSISFILVALCANFVAMASKYFLKWHQMHIFNPVAAAALLTGYVFNLGAIWWISSDYMVPLTLLLGLLIVKKTQRFKLFVSFVATAFATIMLFGSINNNNLLDLSLEIFTSWPVLFFATVMLTEPLTMPPTNKLRVLYGVFVGMIFGTQFRLGPIYPTPEFALLAGNLVFYAVSPRKRYLLTLIKKTIVGKDIYEFIFKPNKKINYKPGQYMEWTLPHEDADVRGYRRYFTLASSPTEENIKIGIKFNPNGSSFKNQLSKLNKTDKIFASQVAGDFTLTKDPGKTLVFIAGGIGITPFRSMVKYLIDKDEKRSIVLFYATKTVDEVVYKDLFEEAKSKLNLKTVYILAEKDLAPSNWPGKTGFITEDIIKEEVEYYSDSIYYLSGPNAMVENYKKMLHKLGIANINIKTDYFPGF